jgi:hypothetical protein
MYMEAHLALLGWEPVRQSFDDRLFHPDRRMVIRVTAAGRLYAAVEKPPNSYAAIAPSEYCCILDNQLEVMFNRVLEIENESQDG